MVGTEHAGAQFDKHFNRRVDPERATSDADQEAALVKYGVNPRRVPTSEYHRSEMAYADKVLDRMEARKGASEGHYFDEEGNRLNARGEALERRPMSVRDWTDVCAHCGKDVKFDRESESVHDRWFDFYCPANEANGTHELSG